MKYTVDDIPDRIPMATVEAAAEAAFNRIQDKVRALDWPTVSWQDLDDETKQRYIEDAYVVLVAGLQRWPGLRFEPCFPDSEDYDMILPLPESEYDAESID